MNLLKILSLFSLFLSNLTLCYVYDLAVFPGNRPKQIIIFLSDYHDKKHPASREQRIALERILRKCIPHKTKLIVEDLSSVNNDGRMICCNYGINCADGMLSHLAHKAREMGIVVDNVEYRYCRVAAIGPVINNIDSDPHSFRSTAGITLNSLHQEIEDEITKITHYDDGKKMNAFYKQAIRGVRDTLPKLSLCKADRTMSVARYCVGLRSNRYRQELEKLCIFDSALIDSNIIHSLACSQEELILVVAGGSHIEQICNRLRSLGYKQLYTTISVDVTNSIDISVLEQFIPKK